MCVGPPLFPIKFQICIIHGIPIEGSVEVGNDSCPLLLFQQLFGLGSCSRLDDLVTFIGQRPNHNPDCPVLMDAIVGIIIKLSASGLEVGHFEPCFADIEPHETAGAEQICALVVGDSLVGSLKVPLHKERVAAFACLVVPFWAVRLAIEKRLAIVRLPMLTPALLVWDWRVTIADRSRNRLTSQRRRVATHRLALSLDRFPALAFWVAGMNVGLVARL